MANILKLVIQICAFYQNDTISHLGNNEQLLSNMLLYIVLYSLRAT